MLKGLEEKKKEEGRREEGGGGGEIKSMNNKITTNTYLTLKYDNCVQK